MDQELIIRDSATPSFEDFRNENGMVFWWASDFMKMLGYDSMQGFRKVIDRATNTMISLSVKHYEHIIPFERNLNGKKAEDFKLTRFACYLVAMNGDTKKPEVAQAQAYFVEQTRKFEVYVQGARDIDRILYREELKQGNKALASAAKNAGVTDFKTFSSKGYLGLYNSKMWRIKEMKGLGADSRAELQDYMGRTELAANLFRVTQTEERLKKENIKGQSRAEDTHYKVAKAVRDLVKENTGKYPEELPAERRLPELKKELKKGMKFLAGVDKK